MESRRSHGPCGSTWAHSGVAGPSLRPRTEFMMSDPAKRLAETLSFGSPLPEGMELPPSGVRTMAVLRWALVALMAVAAATAWIHWAATRSHEMQSAARYRCPMHPSVVQERAGECPICGMDLVLLAPVQPRHHAAGGLGG